MFHCFDHEILLEGKKEEIANKGALLEPMGIPITCRKTVSKTKVDVVDKQVNSETKLSTREVCVLHEHPISRPEGAKRIGSNEAFPFRMKNGFQKLDHEVGF